MKQKINFYHLAFTLSIFTWLLVYIDVLIDMVGVWSGSETYTYCYLILPIVLYLIHEKKIELFTIPLRTNAWFLIPLTIGQIGFLLSELASVGLLTHIAAYGSLICIIGTIYGYQLIKFLAFPLSFLILSVPMGEELVPILQNVTADISVYLVQFVNIPVYREGLYIYIPNGTFLVAEACSGIRFLISMIAIGTLYAYLFYQSIWRRIAFILLSIIIPILANGVRAFGIIYIGHVSDMTQAVGADHLVYGWLFFSVVLVVLMAVGRLWQEPIIQKASSDRIQNNKVETFNNNINRANISVVIGVFCLMLFKPIYIQFIVGKSQHELTESSIVHFLVDNNAKQQPPSWGAYFDSADIEYSLLTQNDDIVIELYLAIYHDDNAGKELISSANKLFDVDKFSLVSQSDVKLMDHINATWLEVVSVKGVKKHLIYWYQVNDVKTSNKIQIKKAQLIDKLKGGSGAAKVIVMAVEGTNLDEEKFNSYLSQLSWMSE